MSVRITGRASGRITVRAGSVYLPAALAAAHFPGAASVVILIREGRLCILPVHSVAAGGCLLKVRNAAGDRVATAPDVFRAHGLEDWAFEGLEALWSPEQGALIVALPEKL